MLQKDLIIKRESLYCYIKSGTNFSFTTDYSTILSIEALKNSMSPPDFNTIVADNDYEAFYQACVNGSHPIISILLGNEPKHQDAALRAGNYRAVIEAALLMDCATVSYLAKRFPHHKMGMAKAFINFIVSGTNGAYEKLIDDALKIILPSISHSNEMSAYAQQLPPEYRAKWFPHLADFNPTHKVATNGVRKGVNIALGCITIFSAFMTGISRYYNLSSSTVISTSAYYITMGSLVASWFSNEKAHLIKKVQDNPGHQLLPGERNIIKCGRAIENIWQSRTSQSLFALCEFVGKLVIDATGFCIASIKTLCSTASEPVERTQAVIDHKPATFPSHDHKQGFGREHF